MVQRGRPHFRRHASRGQFFKQRGRNVQFRTPGPEQQQRPLQIGARDIRTVGKTFGELLVGRGRLCRAACATVTLGQTEQHIVALRHLRRFGQGHVFARGQIKQAAPEEPVRQLQTVPHLHRVRRTHAAHGEQQHSGANLCPAYPHGVSVAAGFSSLVAIEKFQMSALRQVSTTLIRSSYRVSLSARSTTGWPGK